MSTQTTHYGLEKPADSDYYNINVQNGNMDKIDAALHNLSEGRTALDFGAQTSGYAFTITAEQMQQLLSDTPPEVTATMDGMTITLRRYDKTSTVAYYSNVMYNQGKKHFISMQAMGTSATITIIEETQIPTPSGAEDMDKILQADDAGGFKLKESIWLPLNGGRMNGDINLGGHKIIANKSDPFLDNGDSNNPFPLKFDFPAGVPVLLFGGTSINDAFFYISRTGSSYGICAGNGYTPNGPSSITTKKYVDEEIGKLPAPPNLKFGTYVGTGTYGSGSQNSLTFDFYPDLVIISSEMSGAQVAWPLLVVRTNPSAFELGEGAYTCKVSWTGKTLKWYSTVNAGRQMNYEGRKYYYVAIG